MQYLKKTTFTGQTLNAFRVDSPLNKLKFLVIGETQKFQNLAKRKILDLQSTGIITNFDNKFDQICVLDFQKFLK